jgi:ATP-binding cassette, subfamily B, bacterial
LSFKHYTQYDAMDCGPTCLRMVAHSYGKKYSLEYLRDNCFLTREGVSLFGISEAAEKIGLRTISVKIPIEKLIQDAPLPCILHWNQNHFVVLYKIEKAGFNFQNLKSKFQKKVSLTTDNSSLNTNHSSFTTHHFFIADPGHGLLQLSEQDFKNSWLLQSKEGVAMLLEPTPAFYESEAAKKENGKKGFGFLLQYLRPYKASMVQLFCSVLIGSGLSLVFPFLTQSLVDHGINNKNVPFVILILVSQLTLFAGSTAIELLRGWLMLHINSRINIVIISDFLIKLMRLPIAYFDTKLVGDIQQRIGDHSRIQSFLTGSALTTFFSLINLVVFSVVLGLYSVKILGIFFLFSATGIIWIILFLAQRKKLDYVRFQQMSDNQNVLVEMVTAMQEIKLNNCETQKRWDWERVQAKIYKLNVKSLALGQYQQIGSVFFTQIKNILISYISAREVINGNMTMGMMMSVSYIIGQLNSPIDNILSFIQSAQDAKISLDRLSEIHNKEEEEAISGVQNSDEQTSDKLLVMSDEKNSLINTNHLPLTTHNLNHLPLTTHNYNTGIHFQNVSFQYQGSNSPMVLQDINLHIPAGKVTAIVGASGSGKTTMLKLILGFYAVSKGSITIDGKNILQLSPKKWRSVCGTVMQDGHIFSDTIGKNINLVDEVMNHDKLRNAVHTANIQSFIEDLPLNYNTKIGAAGTGISAGQRQRLLIARAVYKNPDYLFFDEATSALDANNEKEINNKLQEFYNNKTVVIIAHRLSTVKNADQIIVLDKGTIAEQGTHASLIAKKGFYFELIKNQLELGD